MGLGLARLPSSRRGSQIATRALRQWRARVRVRVRIRVRVRVGVRGTSGMAWHGT